MGTDNVEAFSEGVGLITNLLGQGTEIDLPEHWAESFRNREKRNESPTSLINYVECPLKWFSDRHAPENQGGVFVPNTFSVIGNYAHRVLELFFDLPPEERTQDTLYDIDDSVWEAMSSGNVRGGVVDASMIRDFQYVEENPFGNFSKRRNLDFIHERGSDAIDAILDFSNPQDVDVLGQEKWTRIVSNGLTVNGKIDRLDKIGEGKISLVDYKTGKDKVPEGYKPDFDDLEFIKSGMYSVMEGPEAVKVEQFYLKEPCARYGITVTPDRREFITKVIETVTSGMNKVEETGVIEYRPGIRKNSGACQYCPIKEVCPAWNSGSTLEDVADFLAGEAEEGGA